MTASAADVVLLATKLHPPVGRGLVSRHRLVRRIRPREYRLTLLEAPAGWGKTSLLADWAASPGGEDDAGGGAHVGWLALDPADNDPVLFWSYVLAALRAGMPASGAGAEAALRSGGRAVREAVLPGLVNELTSAPDPVVLVLDDYHVVTEPEIHHTLSLLLERSPDQLHVVIASRTTPPLAVNRLRAAGELATLTADELAFTEQEAAALLNGVRGLDLSPEQVTRLARRTEGWPAGMSLAGTSLAQRTATDGLTGTERAARRTAFVDDFTGTDRYVLDYLCGEVLTALPDQLHTFVLRTSILQRLTASLCEAVTGRADSAALLDRVERSGLFLARLDAGPEWFRYHRLFADVIRHELTLVDPAGVAELHRRAARWHEEAGSVGEAVAHRVSAGDVDRAGDLVSRHWQEWFNGGRLATVAGWLDLLPPHVVSGDARLCSARAWLALDLGRIDEVDAWIVAGDEAVRSDDLPARRDLAVLRCVYRFKVGDLAAAQAAARHILELEAGTGFAGTVAHLLLGVSAFWRGELDAAARPLDEAVRLARRGRNVLAEAYGLGYLGLLAVHAGRFADARRIIPVALERAAEPAVSEHFVAALPILAQSELMAAGGRIEAAVDRADRALTLSRRGAGRLELAMALVVRAETVAAAGVDGRRQLEEAGDLIAACPDPGRLPARLARARRVQTALRRAAPAPSAGSGEFSERERELLPLLAGTLSQREIGERLHLSLNTIKTHCRVLFRKLGVSSRAQAVSRARQLGLL